MEPQACSKAPTLEEMLIRNRELIQDCLRMSGALYRELTSDDIEDTRNDKEANCIMSDIMSQNTSLNLLENTLSRLTAQIISK